MTDTSAPFDGEGLGWAEAQWYRHMPAAMPSGVIGSPAASASTGPLAFSSSGLDVTIGVGDANVGGAGFERTGTPAATAVTPNGNATLARRDRIVLRRSLGSHDVTVTRIQGTPSGSPVAPDITRDATTFDLLLFSFLVPANNGTAITGVVDERSWVATDGGTGGRYYDEGSGTGMNLTTTATAPSWTPSLDLPAGTYDFDVNGHFELSVSAVGREIDLHLYQGTSLLFTTDFDVEEAGSTTSRDHSNFTRKTLASAATVTVRASASATGGTQAITSAAIRAVRVA